MKCEHAIQLNILRCRIQRIKIYAQHESILVSYHGNYEPNLCKTHQLAYIGFTGLLETLKREQRKIKNLANSYI